MLQPASKVYNTAENRMVAATKCWEPAGAKVEEKSRWVASTRHARGRCGVSCSGRSMVRSTCTSSRCPEMSRPQPRNGGSSAAASSAATSGWRSRMSVISNLSLVMSYKLRTHPVCGTAAPRRRSRPKGHVPMQHTSLYTRPSPKRFCAVLNVWFSSISVDTAGRPSCDPPWSTPRIDTESMPAGALAPCKSMAVAARSMVDTGSSTTRPAGTPGPMHASGTAMDACHGLFLPRGSKDGLMSQKSPSISPWSDSTQMYVSFHRPRSAIASSTARFSLSMCSTPAA
mmetsp:Transcript_71265/g.218361  ORF Transcript_71265/g.218361 Transcript_71265/m.218361 type:complete len:285 (-) Transcript_71265:801-1655(-)